MEEPHGNGLTTASRGTLEGSPTLRYLFHTETETSVGEPHASSAPLQQPQLFGEMPGASELQRQQEYDKDIFAAFAASSFGSYSAPLAAFAAKHAAVQAALRPRGLEKYLAARAQVSRRVHDLLLSFDGLVDPEEAAAAAASATATTESGNSSAATTGERDEQQQQHGSRSSSSSYYRAALKSACKRLLWLADDQAQLQQGSIPAGIVSLKCCIFKETIQAVLRQAQVIYP